MNIACIYMKTQNNLSNSLIRGLSIGHVLLLTISNILVQYPFNILGFHTTWGAFTYPAIFILTDLTTRLSSAEHARKIIFRSMFPALLISYAVASYIEAPNGLNWSDILVIHTMPLRIALACFVAYVLGQLIDIAVFQRYRYKSGWWLAPTLSSLCGNLIDTFLFFSIAFYHCSNPILNQHWTEIALVDCVFKITCSLIAFVPVYGFVLNMTRSRYTEKVVV